MSSILLEDGQCRIIADLCRSTLKGVEVQREDLIVVDVAAPDPTNNLKFNPKEYINRQESQIPNARVVKSSASKRANIGA